MKIKFIHRIGPVNIPEWSAPAKGLTIAYFEKEGKIYAGLAIASNREKEWCKWKGRMIAEGRLQIAFGSRALAQATSARTKLDMHTFSVQRDPTKTVPEQLLGAIL